MNANVEFHNCAEFYQDGTPGAWLQQRVPESVRACLNQGAQTQMRSPAGNEIRFVADTYPVRLTLSSLGGATAAVFHGNFQGACHSIGKEPQTIEIKPSERLASLAPDLAAGHAFNRRVTRVVLSGTAVRFHGIEGAGLRPPLPDELPKRRLLAYGTSITHGALASRPHLTYVFQAARFLGADAINLGVAGAAHCEPELADYMAARRDWDIATLELSVNMVSHFGVDEFRQRAGHMVHAMAAAEPRRPVVCMSILPCYFELTMPPDKERAERTRLFRLTLEEIVAACPTGNAHFISGHDLLRDLGGLTGDLVHPGDFGMQEIGAGLARACRGFVETQAANSRPVA